MIKINLNNPKSSSVNVKAYGAGLSSKEGLSSVSKMLTEGLKGIGNIDFSDIKVGELIRLFSNIALIACFPLGVKIYEIDQIRKLKAQEKQKQEILLVQQKRLSSVEVELKSYSNLKKKSKEFLKKKKFLKKLAESRIIIPRTVDLIQNKIPKTVWLEHLKLELLDQSTRVELSGNSFTEDNINLFATLLQEVLEKNSITVKTEDIKESNSIVKVKFNLQGDIQGRL